jgi:hypothetical protein
VLTGRRLIHDEQGQSAVLVALTAIVFIALLAFLADVGQVIHDKMLTQAVADAAALSAANVQAVGMNEIADLNAEIKKLAKECKDDFKTADNKFEISQGIATYEYYETQIAYLRELQDDANTDFAKMAKEAAQRIVDMNNENYQKLYPTVSAAKHKGLKPIEKWTMEEVMGDPYPKDKMGQLETAHETTYNWTEYVCTCEDCDSMDMGVFTHRRNGVENMSISYCVEYPYVATMEEWRKLSTSTKVYFRIRVKRQPVRALVDMAKYGFSVNIPEVTAYSQAQPNKGDIEEADPDYEARLAPLWQSYPNETDDSDYLSLQQDFKH